MPADAEPDLSPEALEALERDLNAAIDSVSRTLAGKAVTPPAQTMPAPAAPPPVSPLAAAAIGRTRACLEALIARLNATRPAIRRVFVVGSQCDLDGLRWADAYLDHQDPAFELPAVADSFALHYQLSAPGSVALMVDPKRAQATVEVLLSHDLSFALRDGIGAGSVETLFSVNRVVRCSLTFRPDAGGENVLVTGRNLEALGTVTYRVAAAALDERGLGELADFLSGKRPRLPPLFSRQVIA